MSNASSQQDGTDSLIPAVDDSLEQLDSGQSAAVDEKAIERIKAARRRKLASSFSRIFFLRTIDPATRSIDSEIRFEVPDRAELMQMLDIDEDDLPEHVGFDLEPSEVEAIIRRYGLVFDPGSMPVAFHTWHPNDERPYKVHTHRELAMMLAGTKPFAVFVEEHPSLGNDIIPEREFEPHVVSGRVIKREDIEPPAANARPYRGHKRGTRRVLYALAREAWRIDAYLLLRKTAEKSGWNEGFERMEGTLLGYEDWQNDFHIAEQKSRMKSSTQPK